MADGQRRFPRRGMIDSDLKVVCAQILLQYGLMKTLCLNSRLSTTYVPDVSPYDLAKICRKPAARYENLAACPRTHPVIQFHAKRASCQSPVKRVEKGKNPNPSV